MRRTTRQPIRGIIPAAALVLVSLLVAAAAWGAPSTRTTQLRVDSAAGATTGPTPAPRATQVNRLRWGRPQFVAAHVHPGGDFYPWATVRVHGRRTMAVWPVQKKSPRRQVFRWSSRGAVGRWSKPVVLGRVPGEYSTYNFAIGPQGTAILVWEYDSVAGSQIMETHREHGAWSTPHELSNVGTDPKAVIDGRGVMTVAWIGSQPVAATRRTGGHWTPPTPIAPHGYDLFSIATNAAGDVAAFWQTTRGLQVAIRRHGKHWTPPHMLRTEILPDEAYLEVGPAGRVLAVWPRSEDDDHFSRRHLAWARTRTDGRWSRVKYLDTRRTIAYGTYVELSMNSHGRAIAVWDTSELPGIMTAFFDFDHGWTAPKRLAGPPRYCCASSAWLSDTGTAVTTFGPRTGSNTVTWAHKSPGHPWRFAQMRPPTIPAAADGAGRRMALLVLQHSNLRARILTVPRRTKRHGGAG